MRNEPAPIHEHARPPVPVRGAAVLFLFASVVRVLAIFVLDSPSDTALGVFEWGYEAGCIAESMHAGHGFANPWGHPTPPWDAASGPTAWLSPVYPGSLALAMALCGGLVPAMALFVFVMQSLVSAATCVMAWALGNEMGNARAGKLAGWCWALYPAAVWNAAHTVWDTTLVAFGIVTFVWALLRLGRAGPVASWVGLGLLFGALLLCNAAPLALVPAVLWWTWHRRLSTTAALTRAAAFALAAFVVVLPWLERNRRELGAFTLRTNLGVELEVGNNDSAAGRYVRDLHPSHSAERFTEFRALGEVEYARAASDRARTWIAAHPARFAALCLRRLQLYWIGEPPFLDTRESYGADARHDPKSWIKWIGHLALGALGLLGAAVLARRREEGLVVLLALLVLPTPYYVTHVMERYRFPIEPVLAVAASWLIVQALDARRSSSRSVSSVP